MSLHDENTQHNRINTYENFFMQIKLVNKAKYFRQLEKKIENNFQYRNAGEFIFRLSLRD